jgi:F-type H+-transporting ATPase subunit b
VPQLAVETYASQIFWVILGFALVYIFMSRFATPKIEALLQNRSDYIKNFETVSAELQNEADKLDNESFVELENAEIEATATESKLMSDFRKQNLARKNQLFEKFSKESQKESAALTASADEVFQELSSNMDVFLNTSMNRISCSENKERIS